MDTDDLLPPPKPKPEDLETFSIEALEGRIQELEAEIERIRGFITRKKTHRGDADSFFKS